MCLINKMMMIHVTLSLSEFQQSTDGSEPISSFLRSQRPTHSKRTVSFMCIFQCNPSEGSTCFTLVVENVL